MKLVHKTWNNEVVNDEIVKNDLHRISGGELTMQNDQSIKQLVATSNSSNNSNKNNNKNSNQNKNNNKNNNKNSNQNNKNNNNKNFKKK